MKNKYTWAFSLSLLLHLVLAGVLFFGDFTSDPKPMPKKSTMEPIQAVVIDKSKVDKKVAQIKKKIADKKAAENKRLRELEKKLSNAKNKRLKEEKRIKTLEKQRKLKEQEKKKADKAAKKSKEKAKLAEKARQQKVAEKQKADKAAALAKAKRIKEEKAVETLKKAAAEKKRKAQEERERKEQEKLLEQQMAQEMATRQAARKQQMMSEINRFTALIIDTIQRNLITDRSSMEGKSCKLTISLAPSGFVTNVSIGQGTRVVCDAAKNAILKANTLPVSKDPEVFNEMRKISVTVSPEF